MCLPGRPTRLICHAAHNSQCRPKKRRIRRRVGAHRLRNMPHGPIEPADVKVSVRGGDNVSRQINDLLPPVACRTPAGAGQGAHTPSGNWSSYPPHKHDVHLEAADGSLIEADRRKFTSTSLTSPEGYAYQRVYTGAESPLQKAGMPIDVLLRPREDCAVLVPEGYHPVTSAPGYTTYYLNVLAGSVQVLTAQDDPLFTWATKLCGQR